MTDKGAYIKLWRKYLPVVSLMLKKTLAGEQKLKFYKHEFENNGARSKTGYIFKLQLVNGTPTRESDKKAIVSDLMDVIAENEKTAEFLKEKSFSVVLNRAYELTLVKL